MTWEVARSARGRYASSSRPPGWPARLALARLVLAELVSAELVLARLALAGLALAELAAAEGPAQLRREAQPPLRIGMRQRREDLQAAAAGFLGP